MPALLDSVRPVLLGCRDTTSALATIIPKNQFWRWKDLWSNSIRTAIFAALLIEYLTTRGLLTIAQAAETLGSASISYFIEVPLFTLVLLVQEEWSDRMTLPVEDYLHSVISLVNELVRNNFISCNLDLTGVGQSRLAINAVTLGNFEEPIRISIFVKDLFAGFSMVDTFSPICCVCSNLNP